MKNTYSTLRVVVLSVLLFHAPQTLQREVKGNLDGNIEEVMAKKGKRSFNIRNVLSAASQEDILVSMEITPDEEDRPRNEDNALFTTTSTSASNEGSESEVNTKPPSIYFGPLSECAPKCVKGVEFYQERYAVCRDYLGVPVHMSECAPTKKSWNGSFVACPVPYCDESWMLKLNSWRPCPETCTRVLQNGTVVPDTIKRRWKCKRNTPISNSFVSNGCMSLIKKLGLTLERECPLKPCKEFRMEPSSWGNCDCGTWTQERTSHCKDNAHPKLKIPLKTCQNFGLELVDEARRCLPQKKCDNQTFIETKNTLLEDTFNFCNYFNCSTHGTCKDNNCRCEEGFSGHDCQWDSRTVDECLPPSILLGDGTCCKSGIYNYTGHCCPGNNTDLQLDKNGECCVGELDICGNCNPEEPEFRDVRGACCKVLDAGGFCCPSGKVDECGVCDGLSLTCKASVSLSVHEGTKVPDYDECTSALHAHIARNMRVHLSAVGQKTLKEGRKFRFTAQRVIVSSGLLAKKVKSATKGQTVRYKCGSLVNITVYRSPICGNSFCEIGEASPKSRFHCPKDCTYEIAGCPLSKDRVGRLVVCSGHGSCSFREKATCECFEGYIGSNCEKCQHGFFSLGKHDSRCLPRQAYINGPTYYTPPTPVPEQPPIEAPMSTEEPCETPFSVREPSEAPFLSEVPVEASVSEKELVEAPVSEEAPVEGPFSVQSPVEAHSLEETPIETPISEEEPTTETPVSEETPVEAPFFEASMSEEAPIESLLSKASVSGEGPVEAPISLEEPVRVPASEEAPIEAPISEEVTVEVPLSEEGPVKVPLTEEPAEAPMSTEEPYETPVSVKEPVEALISGDAPTESPLSEASISGDVPTESPLSEASISGDAPTESPLSEASISGDAPTESPLFEPSLSGEAPVESTVTVEAPVESSHSEASISSEAPVESPLSEEAPVEVSVPETEPSETPLPATEPETTTPIPSPEWEPEEKAVPFSMHFGPFSECYPSCVSGVDFYKERFAICRDYLGIPVDISKCSPTKEFLWRSYMMCPHYDCDEDAVIELLSWDPCPSKCTEVTKSGTIVPDHVVRDWNCITNTDYITNEDKSCQSLVEKLGLETTRECPLKPCRDYRIEPSNWRRCDCNDWTQKRKNLCNHDHEAKAKDPLKTCQNFGLKLIDTSRRCLPRFDCDSIGTIRSVNKLSFHLFDFCGFCSCSTHGTCKNNECQCEEGFSGIDCQLDQREGQSKCVPPSILLGDGTCCESGIYNYTGHCCPGDNTDLQLDKNGDCCVGELDMCGNCNPKEPEFRDMRGTCCKVLDAGGFCCPSGNVDECGVCDGLSLTCNTTVSISFQKGLLMNEAESCTSGLLPELAKAMWVQESTIETKTVDEGSFTFTATGVLVSSGLLKKKVTAASRGLNISTLCGRMVTTTVYRSAKCGNSFCEIGEASPESDSHCPQDCTYEIARCPSSNDKLGRLVVCNGHGSCSFRETATCECFEGYTGDSCDQCQFGFSHIGPEDSRCLPRQAYIKGTSPSVQKKLFAAQ